MSKAPDPIWVILFERRFTYSSLSRFCPSGANDPALRESTWEENIESSLILFGRLKGMRVEDEKSQFTTGPSHLQSLLPPSSVHAAK